mgnify:CR=1 FL=1
MIRKSYQYDSYKNLYFQLNLCDYAYMSKFICIINYKQEGSNVENCSL